MCLGRLGGIAGLRIWWRRRRDGGGLAPADGEVPAEVGGAGAVEDAGVFAEFGEDLGAFGA